MMLERAYNAYVEAALWSSTDESDESGGVPLDENYSEDDLSDEAKHDMFRDVSHFVGANSGLIFRAGLDAEQVGHDFWLTRNGHGTGFWDRGLGAVGEELSKAAKAYGSSDIYVGDDGLLYVT